ncbi:hypothetical protein FQN60_008575 [Etheostoma spectabile]|uniref:Ig-like domain-containing protein n=1 Tax=Etheostoma spectabile TaxID=54343 RepID=A0A5J5CLX9_9PERO|nr:hypothetical protein FQN60_008575 [Etheostoma spectabile]
MQWYQKSTGGRALKRIGHVYYNNIEHEKSFKEHFNITGDMSGDGAKNVSLFIYNLKAPDHSAVYYFVCLGLDVRQSPSDLITKSGDKVEILCSHEKTDYRVMLWYQRSPGDTAMKLIGYLNYNADTMEEPFKEHFKLSGDLGVNTVKNASLIVKVVGPEHGVCLGLDVRQSSSDLIMKSGDQVQIFCSHDKTDYRLIYWYQRSPGDTAMKLIGYLYFKDVTMEEAYKEHFSISGDLGGDAAKNASLIFRSGFQHSAVYYCAASLAQWRFFISPSYKNYSNHYQQVFP